jgi:hypothetical protein
MLWRGVVIRGTVVGVALPLPPPYSHSQRPGSLVVASAVTCPVSAQETCVLTIRIPTGW